MKSERNLKYPDDNFSLRGHNVPGMLLYEGSLEFEILQELFVEQVQNFSRNMNGENKNPELHIENGKIVQDLQLG